MEQNINKRKQAEYVNASDVVLKDTLLQMVAAAVYGFCDSTSHCESA